MNSQGTVSFASCFIVGCGDVGERVARLELQQGRRVFGLTRTATRSTALANKGIEPVPGDLDRPATLVGLPEACDVLYYFAPPPGQGVTDPRIDAFLAALSPAQFPNRLVYISTSGVYGDCGGAWVNEDHPVNPITDRAKRRLDAERHVQHWAVKTGVAVIVLRVPGIYGPGRLPIERLRQAVPVVKPDESPFSNRIHADDLASACLAAAQLGRTGSAYNVSDGNPTTMTDYFNQVADHLALPRPPNVSLAEARRIFNPAMLSFLEESKRLDNRRLLEELKVTLRYPTLADGLTAC